MKIIGLTGGIGSGKSTVLAMFQKLNVPVYVADVSAKRIMHENKHVVSAVIDLFGENAYINGILNRKYIAGLVFENPSLLASLNAIVHPAVAMDFQNFCQGLKAPYVVYESALIFENEKENEFDEIIVVSAPEEERIARVLKRDQTSVKDVKNRMKNQLTQERKLAGADFVIENTSLEKTQRAVLSFHEKHLG